MNWLHSAKCLEHDPELFFPIGHAEPARTQTETARAVCLVCPVRDECLEWALDTAQDHGVWGGLSEDERRIIRRSRRLGARRPAFDHENALAAG